MDLPFDVSLITHALEHEREVSAWDLWISLYPNFTKDTFVSFDKFMDKLYDNKHVYENKSFADIRTDMLKIVENYERKEVL